MEAYPRLPLNSKDQKSQGVRNRRPLAARDRVESESLWRPIFACHKKEQFLTELLSEVVSSSSGVLFKHRLVDNMAGIYRSD